MQILNNLTIKGLALGGKENLQPLILVMLVGESIVSQDVAKGQKKMIVEVRGLDCRAGG